MLGDFCTRCRRDDGTRGRDIKAARRITTRTRGVNKMIGAYLDPGR